MDQDAYRKARKRVKEKKDFYSHLISFAVMSVFFVALNLLTSPWSLWFYWPILGWGIGILFHYFDVFGVPGVGSLDKDWEERAIQEELRKMKNGMDDYPEDDFLDLNDVPQQKEEQTRPRKDWDESDLV